MSHGPTRNHRRLRAAFTGSPTSLAGERLKTLPTGSDGQSSLVFNRPDSARSMDVTQRSSLGR